MDLTAVYSKTTKGVQALTKKGKRLPAELVRALSLVDGRATVEEILRKTHEAPASSLPRILADLAEDGYLNVVASAPLTEFSMAPDASASMVVSEVDEEAFFKALAETETRKRRMKEAAAMAETEKKHREAEARKAAETEEHVHREAREKAAREAKEAEIRADAARKTREEAERRVRQEAERQKIAEAKAREDDELKARKEKAEKEKAAAEQKRHKEIQARAAKEAEIKAAAARRAEEEAAAKARAEEEARVRAEAEALAQEEAERKAREEAERRAIAAAEERARAEEEARVRAEAEALARAIAAAEEKARAEEEARVRAEAEALAQEEAERKAREEAERRAIAAAEEKARAEEEARVRAEAEALAQEEAERKAREEAERRAIAAAEERARAEEEAKKRAEARAQEEAERRAREEAERKRREEAEQEERERAEIEVRARALADARAEEAEKTRQNSPAKPRKLKHPVKWGKAVLIALATLILLPILLLPVVNLAVFIPPIEKLASDRVREPVYIDAVHASLWPTPHLRLDGVTIGQLRDFKIPTVRVMPELAAVFGETKTVRSVEVESLAIDQGSLARVISWVGPERGAGKIQVRRITIKTADLAVRGIPLPPLEANVALTATGKFERANIRSADKKIEITVAPKNDGLEIDIAANGWQPPFWPKLTFSEAHAQATATSAGMLVGEIEGRLYGGKAIGSAIIKWGDFWSVEGNLDLENVLLAEAMPALANGIELGGKLDAKTAYSLQARDLATLFANPRVNASFDVRDGAIGNIDLARAIQPQARETAGGKTLFASLTGRMELDGQRYQYRQMKLAAGLLTASGEADIMPNRQLSGKAEVEMKLRSSTIRARLTLSGSLEQPVLRR